MLVPLVRLNGYPSVMALSLSAIFLLIPCELGFLIYRKRVTGEKFFGGVVRYFSPLPVWQYFVWVPVIIILAGVLMTATKGISDLLMTFFGWIPSDYILDMGMSTDFTKDKLITTYIFFLIFVVLAGPVTEELYFRGYLLPRMPERLKGGSMVIHSALFALYHIWTPWMVISRTLGVLPLIIIVKKKENLLPGIISHILLNSIDFFIGVAFILNYQQAT